MELVFSLLICLLQETNEFDIDSRAFSQGPSAFFSEKKSEVFEVFNDQGLTGFGISPLAQARTLRCSHQDRDYYRQRPADDRAECNRRTGTFPGASTWKL